MGRKSAQEITDFIELSGYDSRTHRKRKPEDRPKVFFEWVESRITLFLTATPQIH